MTKNNKDHPNTTTTMMVFKNKEKPGTVIIKA